MRYRNAVALIVLSLVISGCSGNIRPYKKAGADVPGEWITPGYKEEGYLDEEISNGVYWVEYFAHGGYGGYGDPIPEVMKFAHKRAAELCPNGYTDTFKVIQTVNAKFPQLRCEIVGCRGMEMVSGKVTCAN